MKELQNLKGTKILSKKEQRFIKGGKRYCSEDYPCPDGYTCIGHVCELSPYI